MCGISAYIGKKDAAHVVLECLKKLEYRGYDWFDAAALLESKSVTSFDIGHDRWANSISINKSCLLNVAASVYDTTKMKILDFIDTETYYVTITENFRLLLDQELDAKKDVIKTINISNRTLRRIKNLTGYWCNLKMLSELASALQLDNRLLFNNIVRLKTKNSFPINFSDFELNDSLARILGHIIGDGGIHVKKEENKYRVFYVNNNESLTDGFKLDIQTLFPGVKVYFRKREEHGDELWLPSTIGKIFYNMMEYEKFDNVKTIPNMIKSSNDEKILGFFLQALYDDEGYLYPNKKMILIAQVNPDLLKGIRELVTKLGIKPNRILQQKSKNRSLMHYFSITGRENFVKFRDKISFVHPIKKDKLNLLLNNYAGR